MNGKLTKKGRNPGVVDNWLDKLDLYRKNVAYDETCMFRAVSEQLFYTQIYHERVRKESIAYARNHFDEFKHLISNKEDWENHLNKLEKHMVVCRNVEINLISRKYGRDVLIFHANQQQIYNVTKQNLPTVPLMLCLMDDDHYDAVYKKEQIAIAGFCQSLVYKILYENVFKISNTDDIVKAMLYEKTPIISQQELTEKKSFDGKELQPEELGNAIVAPFPFKVAKALDPLIYRNIEYDSWGEVRREMRLGDWYYGDDKLKLGTRCVLNDLETGDPLDCYIQKLHIDEDKCVVYLTKTAEKRVVNYSDLSPEIDAKPWPLPYRFCKNVFSSNTTQLVPMDKIKNLKKKNRERRQSQSASDLTNIPNENIDISAFVGVPLQMANNANKNNNETPKPETSDTVGLNPPQSEGLVTPMTPDINTYPQRYQWEQVHWPTPVQYVPPENNYYPQSPDPIVWRQGAATPYFEYKPMLASAPVTPNVIPYHDTSYPYYFNYQVEPNPPQYLLTPTTPTTEQFTFNPVRETSENVQQILSSNDNNNHTDGAYCHASTPNSAQNSQACGIVYTPQSPQPMDIYPPVLNYPSGTPLIYTAMPPSEMEISASVTMYSPRTPTPIEMPLVPPHGYVYPPGQNSPSVPWYYPPPNHLSHNSQGFIFPPPNNNNSPAKS